MFRVFLSSAAVVAVLSCMSLPAKAIEVYMFKGAGDFSFVNENMHFSRGLNKMSDALNAEGIHSEVRRFGAVDDALATIRKRKPKRIALVGHSMGALASMGLAKSLKGSGVEIAYMALLDIPGPIGVAGDNVDKVENYFTINPVYGRLTNVRSHRDAKNIHVPGYIHNRLDDAPKVQNGVLAAIRKLQSEENSQKKATQPQYLVKHDGAGDANQQNIDPIEAEYYALKSRQKNGRTATLKPVKPLGAGRTFSSRNRAQRLDRTTTASIKRRARSRQWQADR